MSNSYLNEHVPGKTIYINNDPKHRLLTLFQKAVKTAASEGKVLFYVFDIDYTEQLFKKFVKDQGLNLSLSKTMGKTFHCEIDGVLIYFSEFVDFPIYENGYSLFVVDNCSKVEDSVIVDVGTGRYVNKNYLSVSNAIHYKRNSKNSQIIFASDSLFLSEPEHWLYKLSVDGAEYVE